MAVPSEWCARLTKWNIHETRLKLNVEDTFSSLLRKKKEKRRNEKIIFQ
jgi:hypothetical protein